MSTVLDKLIATKGFDGVLADLQQYAHNEAMMAGSSYEEKLRDQWLAKDLVIGNALSRIRKLSE